MSEEQLWNAIINSIGDEILNQGMERLPGIIFYFNLYFFKSLKEKKEFLLQVNKKVMDLKKLMGFLFRFQKCSFK